MHPCGSPCLSPAVCAGVNRSQQVQLAVDGQWGAENILRHILSSQLYLLICLVAEARTSWLSVWIPRMELRSSGLTPEPSLWPSSGLFCCASEQTSLGYIPLNRIALLVVVACPPPSPDIHTLIGWFVF